MCKHRFTEKIPMVFHRCENSRAKDTILLPRLTRVIEYSSPLFLINSLHNQNRTKIMSITAEIQNFVPYTLNNNIKYEFNY